jgi:glycosyltransferase involved in cell wall biosynthesis
VRYAAFATPGELTTPTGGFVYDRRIVFGLRELGWRIETINVGDGFPFPSADERALAEARLASVPEGRTLVIDGLALGTLPDVAKQLCVSHDLIALVHHPLALESGLSPDAAAEMRRSERDALASARRVIVTSPFTARIVIADYGVPAHRLTVVRPGNDRVASARTAAGGAVEMLAVGAVTPRKGYDVLLAAAATLLDLQWRLTIVGDTQRDAETTARVFADITRFGLSDRVQVTGAISDDRLARLYQTSDIFVLASWFEGYGMAFAEAIAHGLPVIGAAAGATPETVPAGARLLPPPGDIGAFALAMRRLIADSAQRQRLAAAARAAAAALPTWEQAAELFSQALDESE